PTPTPAPSPVPMPEPQPEPQLSPLWALLLIPAAAGVWALLRRRGKSGEAPLSGDGEEPPQSENQGT
ncbi:MAG: hypothetical protein IK149_06630, partial [Oscillospiraceae bacterium]|nr:hypothetical protein [Oscillospiraceae bacterium]